jgi:alcohol dehydrogenase
VESFVSTKRTTRSQQLSREAWRLLEANYARVLVAPEDLAARAAMQLGAFYAGTAIELSMLGATHACANPVTARYGTTHGHAIAILLPHVVRWNATAAEPLYEELLHSSSTASVTPVAPTAPIAPIAPTAPSSTSLAARLDALAVAGNLPTTLRQAGVSADDLAALADEAAEQWTGRFNPRPFDARGALEIYQCAL